MEAINLFWDLFRHFTGENQR